MEKKEMMGRNEMTERREDVARDDEEERERESRWKKIFLCLLMHERARDEIMNF